MFDQERRGHLSMEPLAEAKTAWVDGIASCKMWNIAIVRSVVVNK